MITGWFMVDIFNYPAFRILGRISYSAFMCHLFFLKLHMAGIHQPMYLSFHNIVRYKSSFKYWICLNFILMFTVILRNSHLFLVEFLWINFNTLYWTSNDISFKSHVQERGTWRENRKGESNFFPIFWSI